MTATLIVAVPAKGRLKDEVDALFERAGLCLSKSGHERGYSGVIEGLDDVEVAFLSAAEIVHQLKAGRVHMGVTGEDLIREMLPDVDASVESLRPLGFGRADVVVAVPDCWIDVVRMADIEDVAAQFARVHGRRLRVATKYLNLTRRFFASANVAGYRIVESVGATEGTPAAGTAELIVDITTTGTTLKANHLKALEDGLVLQSQAHLFAARGAEWVKRGLRLRDAILDRLSCVASDRFEDAFRPNRAEPT
jgi:ATP phosphoribosyltransferase